MRVPLSTGTPFPVCAHKLGNWCIFSSFHFLCHSLLHVLSLNWLFPCCPTLCFIDVQPRLWPNSPPRRMSVHLEWSLISQNSSSIRSPAFIHSLEAFWLFCRILIYPSIRLFSTIYTRCIRLLCASLGVNSICYRALKSPKGTSRIQHLKGPQIGSTKTLQISSARCRFFRQVLNLLLQQQSWLALSTPQTHTEHRIRQTFSQVDLTVDPSIFRGNKLTFVGFVVFALLQQKRPLGRQLLLYVRIFVEGVRCVKKSVSMEIMTNNHQKRSRQ